MPLTSRSNAAGHLKEIQTVKDWLKGVLGHDVDTATVKDMLRGPMRAVLFDFLIPRARSVEEIKVIRANIYAMGGRGRVQPPPAADGQVQDKELVALQRELAEVNNDLQQLKSDIVLESRDSNRKTDAVQNKINDLASTVALQREFLSNLNTLTSDVVSALPTLRNTSTVTNKEDSICSSTNSNPSTDSEAQLNSLLEDSTSMFRALFIDRADEASLVDCDASIRSSLKSISSSVSPTDLRNWWENGITASEEKISSMESSFESGALIDPVEVIKSEFSRVETKLTKEHIQAYSQAEELQKKVEDKTLIVNNSRSQAKAELLDTTHGLVLPEDFEKLVRVKTAAAHNAKLPLPPSFSTPPTNGSTNEQSPTSGNASEEFQPIGKFKNAKRLEDVTLGLLRSLPNTFDKATSHLIDD